VVCCIYRLVYNLLCCAALCIIVGVCVAEAMQLIVGILCVMMKQSGPSLALVELLFNTHLLETSVANARFVDFAFIAICALMLFMGIGVNV